MRYAKHSWLMIVLTLVLSACNLGQEPEPTPDVGAIFTAAAETVVAQFSLEQTQTALAAPTATQTPTTTPTTAFVVVSPGAGTSAVQSQTTPFATLGVGTQPIVIATSTPRAALATQSGPQCNDYILADETVPDGTVFKPGEDFVKTFKLQNTGTCKWDEGYIFEYLGGTLDGYSIELKKSADFVDPGESITFKLNLTASLEPNTYTNCWRMKSDGGFYFGPYPVCVVIEVKK